MKKNILLYFIIAILFFSCTNKESYQLSVEQILQEVLERKDAVNPEVIGKMLNEKNEKYQFIDLRSPEEFIKGHFLNAINIPMYDILNEDYTGLFSSNKINILYHDEYPKTCSAWMLLKQLGFQKNKVMMGNYNLIKKITENKLNAQKDIYQDEIAKYDFAKIVNQNNSGSQNENKPKAKKKAIKKKKAKKEVEGGC